MSAQKFYKLKSVGFGLKQVLLNLRFFVGISFVASLLVCVVGYVANLSARFSLSVASLLFLFAGLLCVFFLLGLLNTSFNLSRERVPHFSDMFSQYRLFLNYLVALMLYLLIVTGGLILFFVPGIYWGIKFSFFPYFIIDKGLDPIEALNRSSKVVDGAKMSLFFFYLLLFLFAGAVVSALLGIAFIVASFIGTFVLAASLDVAIVYFTGRLIFSFALVFGAAIVVPTFMVSKAFVYNKLVDVELGGEVSSFLPIAPHNEEKKKDIAVADEVSSEPSIDTAYVAAEPVLREHLDKEHRHEISNSGDEQSENQWQKPQILEDNNKKGEKVEGYEKKVVQEVSSYPEKGVKGGPITESFLEKLPGSLKDGDDAKETPLAVEPVVDNSESRESEKVDVNL